MTSKVLIIIATGDKEKARTGLMYARNALKYQWLDDVKIIFFGPSEKLIIEDKELTQDVVDLARAGETIACKFISDKDGTSQQIEKFGIKVEYVGTIISTLIKEGYVPMVW